MLVAFDSKTGNVKRFIGKLKLPAVQIDEHMTIDEPYVLITYTTGFGQIPEKVAVFLKNNYTNLRGIAASGNKNWGTLYAHSADVIAERYQVPVIGKFELSGTSGDVQRIKEEVGRIAAY